MLRIFPCTLVLLLASCGGSATTSDAGSEGGVECTSGEVCPSGVCDEGRCAEAACDDNVQNDDETDVDCGGACEACDDGQGCGEGADCASGVCEGGACQPPTCDDGVQNGDETDVDCGDACESCDDGQRCGEDADCASGVCDEAASICAAASCGDGTRNGDETDLDCGGSCPGCAAGDACARADDCESTVSEESVCQAEACGDSVVQASEECDDGGESASCDDDCTSASCGDGTVNATAGEECDDGNAVDDDLCTNGFSQAPWTWPGRCSRVSQPATSRRPGPGLHRSPRRCLRHIVVRECSAPRVRQPGTRGSLGGVPRAGWRAPDVRLGDTPLIDRGWHGVSSALLLRGR